MLFFITIVSYYIIADVWHVEVWLAMPENVFWIQKWKYLLRAKLPELVGYPCLYRDAKEKKRIIWMPREHCSKWKVDLKQVKIS